MIIGSLAVKEIEETKNIIRSFGSEHICLAADVLPKYKKFYITMSGWQETSSMALNKFLEIFMEVGLKHVICTDISRDGTLVGPNTVLYEKLKSSFGELHIQASGGVGSLNDLRMLCTEGVIIGKAFYEKLFTVEQALGVVSC